MPTPDRLAALTAASIADAVRGYARTGDVRAWERGMREAITRGHTAAAIAGTAERLGTAAGSKLLNERNLSRAERQAIRERVAGQLPYLRQFAEQVRAGEKSEAQVAAQSALYAGAVRATFSEARWYGAGLPAHPGDGSTQCLTQCGCAWALRDGGYYWERGKDDSCPECISREARWRPWRPK